LSSRVASCIPIIAPERGIFSSDYSSYASEKGWKTSRSFGDKTS
jgi:hypothetical protein